jgi:DNA-binding transcriptional ArsR family regulator
MTAAWPELRFTKVPNAVLDGLAQATVSLAALKIALLTLRETIGFRKPAAPLSIGFIQKRTGLGRRHVVRGLKVLEIAGIVSVLRERPFSPPLVSLTDPSAWPLNGVQGEPLPVTEGNQQTVSNGNHPRAKRELLRAKREPSQKSYFKETILKKPTPTPDTPPAGGGNGVSPTPPRNPIQTVVLAYKHARGFPPEDIKWDKEEFPRCARTAKKLLDFFDGDLGKVLDCIEGVSKECKTRNLPWKLETIAKNAGDWKYGKLFR